MSAPILAAKLFVPRPGSGVILRRPLLERLDSGLGEAAVPGRKLTLVSAPAGYGKSTLLGSWLRESSRIDAAPNPAAAVFRPAWLSLDVGDNDPARFLRYLLAALQKAAPEVGEGLIGLLQLPALPPIELILTTLLDEIVMQQHHILLVLDDYHLIEAAEIDRALTFLLQHLPPQLHLVIATREDPSLPLARLRAQGELTELRAADLRFTGDEAVQFFQKTMALDLSPEQIAALARRTEGWAAGLQLAALSLQGRGDAGRFIDSFTGSHRFVLDYLVEEVLEKLHPDTHHFLLYTAILDRLCGPLCEAVLGLSPGRGGSVLQELEQANLFLIPLDEERRWYRYHHLFGELLRQRLAQQLAGSDGVDQLAALHVRASIWYEENGLEIDAFHHATAAGDVDRAARLVEGGGMPLLFRGAIGPVLTWLAGLPPAALDERPGLWVLYASALLFVGRLAEAAEKAAAADAALARREPDEKIRDLIGHVASIQATLAVATQEPDTIIAQSRRALDHLHPDNLPVRTATIWTLGVAHELRGERAAAGRAYAEAIAISEKIGHFIIHVTSTIGLGSILLGDLRLHQAAERFRQALDLIGEPPLPIAAEAHLGLAQVLYAWNDLEAARVHAGRSLDLARQIDINGRLASCLLFAARLARTAGDYPAAAAALAEAAEDVGRRDGDGRLAEIQKEQVRLHLAQGNLEGAGALARSMEDRWAAPLARVHLAAGEPAAARELLTPLLAEAEAQAWVDERLRLLILLALAYEGLGDLEQALALLNEGLALAAPGGCVRHFVDEGEPMGRLLTAAARQGIMPVYVEELAAALAAENDPVGTPADPLSRREIEVLQLIAEGFSNREIGEKLFLAVDTVKGHNRRIFEKLDVRRRTEAVARARELGLL